MRAILSGWWQAEGLPPVERLTDDQAVSVLAKIDLLDWNGRPFVKDEGSADGS